MIRTLAIKAIVIYRNILSVSMLDSCRFAPSCSQYAIDAIKRYGTIKGVSYAVARLLRCQPFCHCGFDPVK